MTDPGDIAPERPADPEPERRRFIGALSHPLATGFALAVGVLLAVGLAATVLNLSNVLISIFLALFLALSLDPAVQAMHRRGIPRALGIVIVLVVFLGIVALIVFVVLPQAVQQVIGFLRDLPRFVANVEASDWFHSLEQTLGVDLSDLIQETLRNLANLTSFLTLSGGLLKAGAGLFGGLSTGLLVTALTLYFVTSLQSMKGALVALMPAHSRLRVASLTDQITGSVGSVVAGGIAMSAINAGVVLILQLVIGSPVAILAAIIAFFVTLLPLVGSVIFWVIGSVMALFVSPVGALVFAIAYLAYMQVEAYVVAPRIMGKRVAVPGALVIIGAMAGATLFGLLGALVAMPIVASILIIIRQVVIPRQDAKEIQVD